MIVARSLDELKKERGSVVTVGTFDGVHLAHQEIVREVVQRARMTGGRSIVITFDPHPKEIVRSARGPVSLLTTVDERIALLSPLGVDVLFVIEFTYEFSQLTSREFYARYLVNGTGVSEVVVGYDHMFGHNREGTIQELMKMGKEFDFSVFAFHPYTVNGEVVSSTQVRRALAAGNVEKAASLLGREYSLQGMVVKGDGRGKTLGYPTANIRPDSERKQIPARGVYLVIVTFRGANFFGMMNIGIRPTVSNTLQEIVEVHLFDFAEDIYGEKLTVTFVKKLRDEQKFASIEDLVRQLGSDKAKSLKLIAEYVQRQ
jgi:riboflavin kinase/FMN adenylyltransferase